MVETFHGKALLFAGTSANVVEGRYLSTFLNKRINIEIRLQTSGAVIRSRTERNNYESPFTGLILLALGDLLGIRLPLAQECPLEPDLFPVHLFSPLVRLAQFPLA